MYFSIKKAFTAETIAVKAFLDMSLEKSQSIIFWLSMLQSHLPLLWHLGICLL